MMKGIFTFFVALLITISAHAASVVVPITIQASAAGTTILPPPPNGFHWVQTFGDEFSTTFANNGTSTAPVTLDTSKWQIEHYCGGANLTQYAPTTYGCAGPTTASDTVSGGLLTMTIQSGAPATRNIIDTAYTASPSNTNQPITPFQQRYGFFVYNAKLPTCSSNEFDLEGFGGTGPSGAVYGELGWVSQVNGGCHYGNLRAYQIDQNRSLQFFSDVNLGDITTSFHQYGLLWVNDATAHGSVSVYVDGVLQTGPYALLSPAFDSGMYFDVYWNPCVGCEGSTGTDPQGSTMQFDWIRAYQLAANANQGPVAIPCGASISDAITANPAGTTFQLAANCTYVGQTFTAKNNIVLQGAGAGSTIIDGGHCTSCVMTNAAPPYNGNGATGVIIDGVTIQNYGPDTPENTSSQFYTWNGWIIRNCTITGGGGTGINLVGGATLMNSLITGNREIGVSGDMSLAGATGSTTISGNEVTNNNTRLDNVDNNAAGIKMVGNGIPLVIQNNYVHDNLATGIWCDVNCGKTVIKNNTVIHNRYWGIGFEVSNGPADISFNVINDNGYDTTIAEGVGIFVSSAANANVHDNNIRSLASFGYSILMYTQNRSDQVVANNNTFQNNTITMLGSTHGNYGWTNTNAQVVTGSFSNNNNFHVVNTSDAHFFWNSATGTPQSFAAYQAATGQDAASTIAVGDASVPGCTHIGCTSGGISLVNKGVATNSGIGTTVSVAIPSTTVNDAEVIGVLWCNDNGCGSASGDVVQAIKVGTQSCTEVPGTFSSNLFDNSLVIIMLSVWECQNISAGQTTVTVTSSTPMWYIAGLASEWTCGATNCSVDTGLGNKAVTNSGTTLAISTNGPTTVTGDLIYSFATGIGTGSGLSTGNTPLNILSTNNLDAYLIAAAPGVYTMNFGNSSAGISAVIAAFKP